MGRGLIIGIVVVIVLVALGIYLFYPFSSNCAVQGEWFDFSDPSEPDECCEGLDNVHSTDSVSVADECYWVGTETGYPGGVCSDCGNGICEDVESVCGCSEDCIGKGKSDYLTVEEFCDERWKGQLKEMCEEGVMEEDEPICNLC